MPAKVGEAIIIAMALVKWGDVARAAPRPPRPPQKPSAPRMVCPTTTSSQKLGVMRRVECFDVLVPCAFLVVEMIVFVWVGYVCALLCACVCTLNCARACLCACVCVCVCVCV